MSSVVQKPAISLDKETHVYTLGQRVIPSVTEILKGAGVVDDRWWTDQGRWRGSVIHLACWYDDQNDLDESTVNELVMGHVNAWRKFRRDTGFTPTQIEQPLYNDLLDFAGTPDRVGGLGDGRPCLPDLKTGASSKVTRYQTVAYASCLESPRKYVRMEVRTNERGNYTLNVFEPSTYQRDYETWCAVVSMYRLRKELNLI